jgi:hypothetical protein
MTLNVDNTVVVNEKVGNDENVDLGHRIWRRWWCLLLGNTTRHGEI